VAINPEEQAALARVAQALKDVQGKLIRVEGHTDDVPTDPKGPSPSNWELSTTRALAVVRLLQEQGVPADRLSAALHGTPAPSLLLGTPPRHALATA
jgi:chemotaxis protein MotB